VPEPTSNPAEATARGERALLIAVFLLALWAYVRAAPPDVAAEGDCCEYVTAAYLGGVPHQPGFPTYMLLATGVAAIVPAEHLARALNWMSCLFGALTVAVVALVALRLARRAAPGASEWTVRGAAVLAALLIGGATEFWNQALSAEVYTLSTFLLALCLERWSAGGSPRRLAAAALYAGLGCGAHYDVGVPCVLLVAAGALRARRELGLHGLARIAGGFTLGLATFLYLPLRSLADPALDFGDPETPARFWRALTLADMPTGKAIAREWGLLFRQIGAVAHLGTEQWPAWVGALFVLGAVACLARRALRGTGLGLAAVFVLDYAGILVNANYEVVDERINELRFLFLPAYLVLALFAGLAVAWLAGALEARARLVARALVCALALVLAPWLAAQARRLDKSADRVFREYGEALLAVPEGPAVLFTWGDNAWMPTFYLQTVHGLRPDVTLVAAGLLHHDWYREQLRARFPELVLDESAPGVAGIARANLERVNLYHADPRVQELRGFQEVPSGVLMRILPAGEPALPLVPPAPAFSPPYAVLDKRERSVRADVLQAYVRTALWCRGAGYLAQATQAFEQGLALTPPEPRMEEFHLARSGLLLELGDFEAARGRLDAAREAWTNAGIEAPGSSPAALAAKRMESFSPAPRSRP
jgi:tetratricopeptide (TPR) repeat protein